MSQAPADPPAAQDNLLRCRVQAPDRAAMRDFIETSGAEVGCRPVATRTDAGLTSYVELTGAQVTAARSVIDDTRADAIQLEVIEDLTAALAERRSEVAAGNRFAPDARGDTLPRGVGRKE